MSCVGVVVADVGVIVVVCLPVDGHMMVFCMEDQGEKGE